MTYIIEKSYSIIALENYNEYLLYKNILIFYPKKNTN